MKLHSLFGSPRLAPAWSFTASHILWRFLLSDSGLLLGEDRDTDAKNVSFFCIDMGTGSVLWRGRTFGEAWWTGIEAVTGNRLYLHGFAKPDMPEHRGLTAVDARTGSVIWSNNDISFFAADASRVIGYRDLFERRVFEEFDAQTGAFLHERQTAGEEAQEMRRGSFGRTDLLFPEPLEKEDPQQPTIERALQHAVKTDPAHPPIIDAARAEGRIIISAHVRTSDRPGSMTHLLLVIDEVTGRELYRDTLNADTPYAIRDSFFIDRSRLYYIKEKQTLVSLPLAS
ncbi:MAG: DUF4905 domain-containing protein [Acidobacteriota bacterium]